MTKPLLPLLFGALLLGGAGCVMPQPSVTPRACTEEAKVCPDGSAVGRTGPNCEFAPCPTTAPVPVTLNCSGPGGQCAQGYTCIQKCGPPVARENDPPPGYYCELNSVASQPRNCPICLASNSMIATPTGEVNVKDIHEGMHVWSLDAAGNRISSSVIAVTHTPVPTSHQVVHLVFSDNREVWVSPNHPTADGRLVGSLKVGELFDGSAITSAELVPYWDTETFDLLPNSATGTYWANGVLFGSTLLKD